MKRALPFIAALVIVGALVAVVFLTDGGGGALRGTDDGAGADGEGTSDATSGSSAGGGGASESSDPSSMAGIATDPGPAPICAPGPAGDSCRSGAGHRPKPPRSEAEVRARLLERDRELVAVREEIAATKSRTLRATGAERERLRARVAQLITRQQGLEQEVSSLQARLRIRPTLQRDAGPP